MSASRRATFAAAVEALWRLAGAPAARLHVDAHAPRGTGLRCPACAGKRTCRVEDGLPDLAKRAPHLAGATLSNCPLCEGQGALRPRPTTHGAARYLGGARASYEVMSARLADFAAHEQDRRTLGRTPLWHRACPCGHASFEVSTSCCECGRSLADAPLAPGRA